MENTYAVIENELVVNLALAEEEFANEQGWVLATEEVQIGWKYIDGQFIPYTPKPDYTEAEILAINKATAQSLLDATDWSQLPDVSNTANTPYLMNADDFLFFRDQVRYVLVDTPKTLYKFQATPTAIWSGQSIQTDIKVTRV